MAYKVKINGKDVYDLKDGFILRKQYNENLDSGTVSFTSYGKPIDIEPFDGVDIYDTENKITPKHMLVDSGDEEIFSYGDGIDNSDRFNTVLLFSQTKELERITLPNCSVTQPMVGKKKSVYDEFTRFCNLYLRKIKVYDSENRYKYVNEYLIDSALRERFSPIECPEFQWNEPTLREVLNDLLSTDDCIAVIRENVITYYDLTEKGEPIDTGKLDYSKRSFSSSDYCSDLTINMKNAIGRNKTIVCEKKGLRTNESELTTENAVFMTQHPIYNIVSCKISYYYYSTGENPETESYHKYHKEVDITDFVVESDIYDLKDSSPVQYPKTMSLSDAKEHQAFLLRYKRGDNRIELWGAKNKYGVFWDQSAGHAHYIMWALGEGPEPGAYDPNILMDIRDIAVDLVYETVSEHNLHAGRYIKTRHSENRLFDNQSNSYVDANHQSIYEYFKVNRLGNKVREIKGTYYDESDIPELGDTIGDEILYESEVEYLDGQFRFIGRLTKNYILRDYFTGVQAKKRSWQLAKESDALTRQDVLKYYLEASFSQKSERSLDSIRNFDIGLFSDSLIGHGSDQALKYAFIRTYADYSEMAEEYLSIFPSGNEMFQVDLNAEVQGMSVVFEFGAMDNVIVDYYVERGETSYLLSKFYKYCNSNGEFDVLRFIVTSHADPADGEFTWASDGDDYDADVGGKILGKIRTKPLCNTGVNGERLPDGPKLQSYFYKYKDNRERIRQTVQIEYCSDTDDIIVTPRFIELCSALNDGVVSSNEVYISADEEYRVNDTKPLGEPSDGYGIIRNVDGKTVQLGLNGADASIKSWGIADSKGDLLLGVNASSPLTRIWLNLLLTRDDNIYHSQRDKTIVGDITDSQEALDNAYSKRGARRPSIKVMKRRGVPSDSLEDITSAELNDDSLNHE